MSTAPKSDYLLLFRGNVWDRGLSPAQVQKVVSDWMAWFERLKAEGKCAGGHPLEDEGKVVSGKQRTVADGPFAESKEAIGGYFYLTVADENEAIEIAKQCPGLECGSVVEVRPVADVCSVRQRAEEYSKRELVGARLYLLFDEGYKALSGDSLIMEDLCREAIRLTPLLAEHPAGNQPRTHALVALMLLNAARLPARNRYPRQHSAASRPGPFELERGDDRARHATF